MGLASLEVIFTIPFACVSIWLDVAQGGMEPYVSWASAHAGFLTIVPVPSAEWKAIPAVAGMFEMSRYAFVFCAFVFFAFFGFADEARRNYRLAYASAVKRVGLSTGTISTTGTWTANGYVTVNTRFMGALLTGLVTGRIHLRCCLCTSRSRRRRNGIRLRRSRRA